MKFIGYLLLGLFLAFGLAIAFLESGAGHRLAKRLILQSLEQSGMTVEIGELQGQFPQDLRLKELRIQGPEMPEITVASAHLDISLSHLLKRELFVKILTAKEVRWNKSPPFDLQGSFAVKKNGRAKFSLSSGKFSMTGMKKKNHWAFEGKFEDAAFRGTSEGFSKAIVQIVRGNLSILAKLKQTDGGMGVEISWTMPELEIEGVEIRELRGTWQGLITQNTFSGELVASGTALEEPWTLKTPLVYQIGGSLTAGTIALQAPSLHLTGEIQRREDGLWMGSLSSESANLQLLRRWRPALDVYGLASVHISFEGQSFFGTMLANEFYIRRVYAKTLALALDPEGNVALDFTGGKWGELEIDAASLTTTINEAPNPFHLAMDGALKDPLHLELDGAWSPQQLALEKVSGFVLNHSLLLQTPTSFQLGPEQIKIEQFNLLLDESTLSLDFDARPGEGNLRLSAQQLPLDLFSFNPFGVSVNGFVTLNAEFHEKNHQTTGQFQATLQHMETDGEELLIAKASVEGLLNRHQLKATGTITLKDQPFLTLDAKLPLEVELWPLKISPLLDKDASGHLAFQGSLEKLLDFVDLGTHRLTGECISDLTLKNTLGNPSIQGYVRVQNGSYENYLTGTELIHLNAECIAKNDSLYLHSLTAQDVREQGTLSATGQIYLSISQKLPFHFDLAFSDLALVQIDLISTTVDGKVALDGDWTSAVAKGAVQIERSDIAIPDRIPRPLPDIRAVYKNAPKPLPPVIQRSVYPLHLNLLVTVPSCLFIEGRGLSSEWKGNFLIGGTFTSPAATGKLELLKGEFLFAGHLFTITEGSLVFTGKEHEMPRLNIAGHTEEHGISVTARLNGPLNHPQLTFQSTPPLPLSSILSHLLFGQDISEITAFQAIQLASSVGTLSGQSPDLLEGTRKSLGIDRLRIISTPTGTDAEGETVAIQVGKYIVEGVIVSVSQGAEDSSTNISVDVDLSHGFFLQVDTDQRQEQGVFGLKWNVNY